MLLQKEKEVKDLCDELNMTQLMYENTKYLWPYIVQDVTDIHINKPEEIFVKYIGGKIQKVKDSNLTYEWLFGMSSLLANISDQEFNEYSHPIVGFKLPGGHRVQVISGGYTNSRLAMAIRINRGIKFDISEFGFNNEQQQQIILAIKNRQTILVSGGTGSGKTSFINSLIPYIDRDERILTIEDVNELCVSQENHMHLLYSASNASTLNLRAHDLFDAALRLDPDRIIVGEIRQKNAATFFNAINSGHNGSMSTIHANSPDDALYKICDYMILDNSLSSSGTESALERLRQSISIVVQLENYKGRCRQAKMEIFNTKNI